MSVCGTSDRTADRRSKGVINLLFKSKVGSPGEKHQVDIQESIVWTLIGHIWVMRVCAFLLRLREEDRYHCHVCTLDMKLQPGKC